jgi:predicted acetyltransferase
MDELALVHPSLICSDRIEDYRARIRLADAAVLLVGGLDGAVCPGWLELLQRKSKPDTCPDGLVPDSTFLCVRAADDALVGQSRVADPCVLE